ncbi:CopG family ribbon-helix-helix protein [Longimicrobium sp.]|uniref:CopG family ribbon-helix-helix protein n=1 Tax=Longimicrobium sp. TaxID=2029185 RepID=UPI002B71A156|nr:ribbon-helix-helix protein, CopG family [Longimicrobium sp.]HSU16944.1 ribbon-helix-helix protein, CopG family [Longimicrobium sp.]
MSETIPITLSNELAAEVDALSEADGIPRDELVRNAVEAYVAERRFDELRARVIPQAQRAGFFTDEDVFREIS